jgi:pimeloyl-ACP methyl ester carboxylesterase
MMTSCIKAEPGAKIPTPSGIAKNCLSCSPRRCELLQLPKSRFHWWGTCLAVRAADIALALVCKPEKLVPKVLAVTRFLSGMRRKDIKADGLVWPYLQGGSGEVVILLHGYGADKDRFGSLVPYLRRRYQVVIPDLPGFGDHRMDSALGYDILSQVLRIDHFIKALGLKHFHLLGFSLGGYVAAMYAAQFPKKILSLALMDCAGLSAPCHSDAHVMFDQSGRNIFLYTTPEQVEDLVAFLIHRPFKLPKRLLDHWASLGLVQLAWRRKLFNDLIDGGLNLLDQWAQNIQATTLLIWGADDRICHVSAVDALLQSIPDCRAYVFQSCGHLPLVEYPRAFRRLYGNFLREACS